MPVIDELSPAVYARLAETLYAGQQQDVCGNDGVLRRYLMDQDGLLLRRNATPATSAPPYWDTVRSPNGPASALSPPASQGPNHANLRRGHRQTRHQFPLGRRIKYAIAQSTASISEVARAMGINRTSLSNFLSGRRWVSDVPREKLASWLEENNYETQSRALRILQRW